MLGWERDISYLKAWPAAFKVCKRLFKPPSYPLCPQRVQDAHPFLLPAASPRARYPLRPGKLDPDAQSYKIQAGGRTSQTVGGCNSNSIRRSAGFRRSRTFSSGSLLVVSGGMADASIALAVSDIQLLAPKSSVLSSPSPSMKWKDQHLLPWGLFAVASSLLSVLPLPRAHLVSWAGSPHS